MSEGNHATLAPSAAERWIQCPASVRMDRQLGRPDVPSIYAMEGTAAHALGELFCRRFLLDMGPAEFDKALAKWHRSYDHVVDDFDEMEGYARAYVDLLHAKLQEHPNSVLLLEQRVPTGVPRCWGTSDAVIVSPEHVEIVDLKYGKGVQVEAEGNPQLRLYGVGALEAFGELLGLVRYVKVTVYQPRLDHTVSETITAAELVAWRDSLIPIAESALGNDAPFGPSEEACRWCPASGRCPAQLEWVTARDFSTPMDAMTADDMAEALAQVAAIEAWCAAVRNQALDMAYSQGEQIPGYKVVGSRGQRKVTDVPGALMSLEEAGYALDDVSQRKIKGIGELEKLLKKDFDIIVGPFVEKVGGGTPSLVDEDDTRPSIQPNTEAAREFAAEEDLL